MPIPSSARFFRACLKTAQNTEGRVTVIRILFRKDGDSARLVIEDDGGGIAPGLKNDLFTTNLLEAKGKGLFLIREILQVSGMTIRENGEPGKGACFEIAIPPGQYRMKQGDVSP